MDQNAGAQPIEGVSSDVGDLPHNLAIANLELEIKRTELRAKQADSGKNRWSNPLAVAIFAAALAATGNAVVAIINGNEQVALEDRKSEQSRILEMLKTGDPDKAAANLSFLLKAGLVENANYVTRLQSFLKDRNPGQGPALSATTAIVDHRDRYWSNPIISVCWENPGQNDASYRDLVRTAVASSWEANSKLKFIGWGPCPDVSRGLRIQISDDAPRTQAIGKTLDGMAHGIVLNFQFDKWSPNPDCKKSVDKCIVATAVHVFGHAIGFAHTQDRPDTPSECAVMSTGGDYDMLTPWDPHSVMNYCNPKWLNDGQLSPLDIEMVQAIYGAPTKLPNLGNEKP